MAYRGKTPTGSHAGGGVRIYSYCFGDRLPPFAHSTAVPGQAKLDRKGGIDKVEFLAHRRD